MRLYFNISSENLKEKIYFDYVSFTSNNKKYVFDINEIDYNISENKIDARVKDLSIISINDETISEYKEILNEEFVEILKGYEKNSFEIGIFTDNGETEFPEEIVKGAYKALFVWNDFSMEIEGVNNI